MKIINLIEDTDGGRGLAFEHGLSFYIEANGRKILVDSGASEKTWENAAKLGIDIKSVDMLFLSHGHYDHSGGIMRFAEINNRAKIYISEYAGLDYFNMLSDRYIGIDKRICDLPNTVKISGDTEIDKNISVFTGINGNRLSPLGNLFMKVKTEKGFICDTFRHEQYVVIKENGKYYLVSGCAHNGIINILDGFYEKYGFGPDFVLSGFHMMKKGDYEREDIEIAEKTAEILKNMNTVFFTGHCTGNQAYEIMKPIMGEKLVLFHSGDGLICDE